MKNNLNKIVILSSGTGSILQAIINYFIKSKFVKIVSIISDKPSLSIQRGLIHNIPCLFLPYESCKNTLVYNILLKNYISLFSPELIVLSGFMKILHSEIIDSFKNKIINIHPSLLPKYKGLNTHERALKNKDKYHGTTVHYVDKSLDGGKIISQKKIEINKIDTKYSLEQKIKKIEKDFYPETIKKILEL